MDCKTFNTEVEVLMNYIKTMKCPKEDFSFRLLEHCWNDLYEMLEEFIPEHHIYKLHHLLNNLVKLYLLRLREVYNVNPNFSMRMLLERISKLLLNVKAKEYSSEEGDRFIQFKIVAERMKTKPYKVAIWFMLKHVSSIDSIIRGDVEVDYGTEVEKFVDAVNYVIIMTIMFRNNEAE